jgi:hypothetical protein
MNDSGRQALKYGIIKKVPHFTLDEQPGLFCEKLPPKLTFQLFNRFSQATYRSIQLNKRKYKRTSKIFMKNTPTIKFQLFNLLSLTLR